MPDNAEETAVGMRIIRNSDFIGQICMRVSCGNAGAMIVLGGEVTNVSMLLSQQSHNIGLSKRGTRARRAHGN